MDEVGETSRITAEDINNTEEIVIPVSESKVAEQYTGISHLYKSIKPPGIQNIGLSACVRMCIFTVYG